MHVCLRYISMTTLHLIMNYTDSNTQLLQLQQQGLQTPLHFNVCCSLSYMYVWPSVSEDLAMAILACTEGNGIHVHDVHDI